MGHYVAPDGTIYVDTKFINMSGRLPGMEIKHMGFGEFTLMTPKGEVEFDRMRGKDFPGQSGRSHKFYPEKLAEWVVEQMERKGLSEKMASSYSYDRTAAGNREVNQILRDMKKHLAKHKKRPDKRELKTIQSLGVDVYAHEKTNKAQRAEADKIEDEAKSIKVAATTTAAGAYSKYLDAAMTEIRNAAQELGKARQHLLLDRGPWTKSAAAQLAKASKIVANVGDVVSDMTKDY